MCGLAFLRSMVPYLRRQLVIYLYKSLAGVAYSLDLGYSRGEVVFASLRARQPVKWLKPISAYTL